MGSTTTNAQSNGFRRRLLASIPPVQGGKNQQATQVIEVDSKRYVVKYARRERGRFWREWLSALACLVLFQVGLRPWQLRSGSLQHEAERLRQLAMAGVAVPEVVLLTPQFLVMSHTGTDVNRLLYTESVTSAQYPALFAKLMSDLAHFHAAGHWHGGAQARNITIDGGVHYRIDFEENTGNALPLDLAQAYDLMLLFSSLADYLLDKPLLAQSLLQNYLQQVSSPGIEHRLGQMHVWLERLLKLEPFLGKKLSNKGDVRRAKLVAATLKHCLSKEPAPNRPSLPD